MPINWSKLCKYLTATEYPIAKTQFLIRGFSQGFSIGYAGSMERQSTSRNIPFTPGVGDQVDLWNKIMIEVKAARIAGPFTQPPFINFIQSPIGLVPKKGNKMRMIFHLSHNFSKNQADYSLNHFTPQEICSTKYNDLDHAITNCLAVSKEYGNSSVVLGKTDLSMAFCMLPIKKDHWKWLMFKARNPLNGEVVYFVDKCLPFGASVSCSHYQRFSNALRHIVETITGKKYRITNYLDDFLFVEKTSPVCDAMVRRFLDLCGELRVPVAVEKTEWSSFRMIFLGILLDGFNLTLSIPLDKKDKAINMLNYFMSKRKATIKELEQLTGYFNFLSKAIFSGRAFTRRMYSKYSGVLGGVSGNEQHKTRLRKYHHVHLDREFKFDCEIWKIFLTGNLTNFACRPIIDVNKMQYATQLEFYTDSSGNCDLGFGATYQDEWMFGR